ncbi:MAG: site-specific integrase [Rhodospirillaceae bacterium]
MARTRKQPAIDPATGKTLPDGVTCRGPKQYRARKLVKSVRTTKTFESAALAAKWLAAIETDVARGQYLDQTQAQRQTLGAIIEQYQTDCLGEDSEKRGADKEKNHLKIVLEDEVCKVKMADLTSSDLAKFRDRMKKFKYAPATIVRRLNLVQTVIEHARREWKVNLPGNPMQMVKRPAGADRKRDRVFLNLKADDTRRVKGQRVKSEEELLLAACEASYHELLAPIVRFAILTAMRQGEIVGLRWKDIDLEKATAVVRGALGTVTKNNEIREVPLLPAAVQLLKDMEGEHTGRVFVIDQNPLKMAFRRATKKAEIEDLTFHDLRHIATSRLAKIYKNPLDLKRVTGHKDLKSLDRYYHTTAEELAAQAN